MRSGIIVTLSGPSELMVTYIFSPVAFLETVCLSVMGVLMGRKTMQAETSRREAAGQGLEHPPARRFP